jgi:hypothetical protein
MRLVERLYGGAGTVTQPLCRDRGVVLKLMVEGSVYQKCAPGKYSQLCLSPEYSWLQSLEGLIPCIGVTEDR